MRCVLRRLAERERRRVRRTRRIAVNVLAQRRDGEVSHRHPARRVGRIGSSLNRRIAEVCDNLESLVRLGIVGNSYKALDPAVINVFVVADVYKRFGGGVQTEIRLIGLVGDVYDGEFSRARPVHFRGLDPERNESVLVLI